MKLLCAIGLHRWSGKATARPGTTVYRCQACQRSVLVHNGRRRRRKRVYLVAAMLVSASMWFVSYNLLVHGRTRVLHTAARATRKAEAAAARGRAAIHRVEGDRGAYLDGNE